MHVSALRDLYIPTISLLILLQENMLTEAAQFLSGKWEYINGIFVAVQKEDEPKKSESVVFAPPVNRSGWFM